MSATNFDNGPATFDYTPPASLLTGRVALVTGANVGLGLETAVHLARLDPRLIILACRDVTKGENAKAVIAERSGLPADRLAVWELDQASFASVTTFANKATSTLDRLDIACLNAGIAGGQWNVTPDGFEAMLQVNDLATGLLALELLPLLTRTATLPTEKGMNNFGAPHLNIVGSDVHAHYEHVAPPAGVPLLEAFNDQDAACTKNMHGRYPFTKLVSLFLARSIAALPAAKEAGVVVNVSNPGMCKSELSRHAPAEFRTFHQSKGKDPVEGAKNILWGCVGDPKDVSGGAYITNMTVVDTSPFSRSAEGLELERGLWAEMAQLWLKLDPTVGKMLA